MLNRLSKYISSNPIGRIFNLGEKTVAWKKVTDLKPGMKIAIADSGVNFDEIISIKAVGQEQVYDIEVENTHNFVGNGILAHNTLIAGNVTPEATGTRDIGTSSLYWNNLYVNNIYAPVTGVSGYWQRNSGAISPANLTDDLLLGTTATSSAKFAFKNIASGTPTASISGNSAGRSLVIDGLGNITTTAKQSLTLGDSSTGNIILNGGNVGIGTTAPGYKLDVTGAANISTTLNVDTIQLTGACCGTGINFNNENMVGLNTITISDSGASEGIQWADAAWSIDNTPIDRSNAVGNLNLYGTSAGANNSIAFWRPTMWIYDAGTVSTASATTTGLNFTTSLNRNITFNPGGNVGIGTTAPTTKLHLYSTAASALKQTIESTQAQEAGLIMTNSLGSWEIKADDDGDYFRISDVGTASRLTIDSSGNVGINDTTPTEGKLVVAGRTYTTDFTMTNGAASNYVLTSDASGNATWATIGAGSITADSLDFTEFQDTLDLDANLILNQSTYTWVQNFTGTTTDGLTYNANSLTSGNALKLSSTSTAFSSGNLANIDWSPGSATTATGDLLRINIGTNGTVGNLFNVLDTGSSLFSVSETAVTSNLPTSFTSSGDVSIAYDLNFTNPTASYIKSLAPLYITSGETFNSSDLNLTTYNKGNVILNTEALSVIGSATISGQIKIAGGTPGTNKVLTSDSVGLASWTDITAVGVGGSGTINYVPKFTAATTLGNSLIYDNGTNVGIGTTAPGAKLDVNGALTLESGCHPSFVTGALNMDSCNSQGRIQAGSTGTPLALLLNAYGGNVGIGTTSPNAKLDVAGSATISATFSLAPYTQGAAGTCNAAAAGKMYYDGPGNVYYFCNGTTWTQIGAGAGGGWTDGGAYLYPTSYESARIYDAGGTDYMSLGHDGTNAIFTSVNTTKYTFDKWIDITGALTTSGNIDINGTSNDIAGTLNLSGNTLTSGSDLTINAGGTKTIISDDLQISGGDILGASGNIRITVVDALQRTDVTGLLSADRGATFSAAIAADTPLTLNSNTGSLLYKVASTGTITSGIADSATAIAYNLDTSNTLSTQGSKLLSLKNNTTEKFYIDSSGNLYTAGTIISGNGMGQLFTNKSGGTVTNRSLVTLDTSNNSSFTTTVVPYSRASYGVLIGVGLGTSNDVNSNGACDANDVCMIAQAGEVEVLLTNAASAVRGDYIFTSATAGSGVSSAKQFDGLIGIVSNTTGAGSGYVKMIFKVQPQISGSPFLNTSNTAVTDGSYLEIIHNSGSSVTMAEGWRYNTATAKYELIDVKDDALATGSAQVNFNTEGNYSQENMAYAVTLTPSATSGDITLTLGSGNWNSDARVQQYCRVSGNSGVATLTAAPAAQTTITATTTTAFANTSAISSGSWYLYCTNYSGSVASLSLYDSSNIGTFSTTSQGQLPQTLGGENAMTTANIGGTNYLYVIGGYGASSTVFKAAIDTSGNVGAFSTTSQAQLPQTIYDLGTKTLTVGGTNYIYAVGGYNGVSYFSTVYKSTIDSAANVGTFSTTSQGQLPATRSGLPLPVEITTIGGTSYIYVIGGSASTVYKATIDGSNNVGAFATTSQAQLPATLNDHNTALVSVGGTNYLYVIGGYNGAAYISTVYKATVDTSGNIGTFSTTSQGQLPAIRGRIGVSVATTSQNNKFIYLVGGTGPASTVYKAAIDSSGNIGTFSTTSQAQFPISTGIISTAILNIGNVNYLYTTGGQGNSSAIYKASLSSDINPYSLYDSTKFLLHADGANGSTTFTDSESTPKSVTAYGNAQNSTAQSKFGGASALLDGAGDYLSLPDSDDWAFGTGNFTIDFWFKRADTGAPAQRRSLVTQTNGGGWANIAWHTSLETNNTIMFQASHNGGVGITLSTTSTFGNTNWHHIAVVRIGDMFYLYVDGVSEASTLSTSHSIMNLASNAYIGGGYTDWTNTFYGYIDEVRIIKGLAAWTAAFSTPSSAYASYSQVYSVATAGDQISTSSWGDIDDVDVTETLNSQTIYYSVSFDGRTTFAVYDATANNFGWRPIARNNSGTWQYNSNTTAGVSNVTWTAATYNSQNGALSQAFGVTQNQMSGTTLGALTDLNWNEINGYTPTTNTLDFSAGFKSSSATQNPQVDGINVKYTKAGYKIVEVDSNTSRLYNYSGATQNLKFGVIPQGGGGSPGAGSGLWTNNNASVANGSYIEVAHNQSTVDLITNGWINLNGVWKDVATATESGVISATNASLADGSYVEVVHNQNTNDVQATAWIYDSNTGRWFDLFDQWSPYSSTLDTSRGNLGAFSTTSQAQLLTNIGHTTAETASIGGTNYVYLMGGTTGSVVSTVYKSTVDSSGNLSAFSTTSQGQLPQNLQEHTSTTVTISGTVYLYVVGGYNGGQVSTVYKATINSSGNISTFATTSQGQLPVGSYNGQTVTAAVGGTNYIYYFGGWGPNYSSTVFKATIDTSGNIGTWATTSQAQYPKNNAWHRAKSITLGGTSYIYSVGGYSNDGSGYHGTLYRSTVDGSGNLGTWTTTNQGQPGVSDAYNGIDIATINGRPYFYLNQGYAGGATSAIYRAHIDPITGNMGTFSTTSQGQLPAIRYGESSTVVHTPSGSYRYVFGGYNNSAYTSTVYRSAISNLSIVQVDPNTVRLYNNTGSTQSVRLNVATQAFQIRQTDTNTVRLYNYSGSTQNLRLDVITGGLGRNSGTVSLAPAAADTDSQASTNTIWINKTGLDGSLLKLQKSGSDIFNISQAGGNAALVLDQRLGGDIFTASASGSTKFTIANSGAVTSLVNDAVIGDGTGGTITYSGGYTIHTFNSSSTFTPPTGLDSVEYLVVGGGGGGGGQAGGGVGRGGGGAGGFRTGTVNIPTQAVSVTVGAGGAGGSGAADGTPGSSSVFHTVTSAGGGYGAGVTNGTPGGGGGSGGGGMYSGAAGGAGTTGQGNNGGAGTTSATNYGAGGGGGASAVGAAGTATTGGNGGAGTASSISGSLVTYAGGGGGGTYNGGTPGSGGSGGGGAGATGATATNGTANTGGGGGGSGGNTAGNGGSGGSGVVIIRYPTSSTDITDILTLDHTTTGTALNGIGTGILMRSEDSAGNLENAGRISGILANATNGSEQSAITFDTRGINYVSDVGTFATTSQGQLPVAQSILSTVTASIGGTQYLYVIGGYIASGTSTVYKSTINSSGNVGAFATTSQGQLPLPFYGHNAVTTSIGGTQYIYVTAGYNGGVSSVVYKATVDSSGNIGTFATTSQGQLPQGLYIPNTIIASIGGTQYIYVTGGDNCGCTGTVSTVYKATLDTSGNVGTFATTSQSQLPQVIYGHGAVTASIGGTQYLYLIGGTNVSTSLSTVYKATIDSSGNIGAFATTSQGQLPATRGRTVSAVTASINGTQYIYVMGGGGPVSTVYKAAIDSSGNIGAFATTSQGQLPATLTDHAAVTASIGGTQYIYVAAGGTPSGVSTVYKATIGPDTGSSTLTRRMKLDHVGNLTISGTIAQSGSPDIAENVRVSDESIEGGDVVMIDNSPLPPLNLRGGGSYPIGGVTESPRDDTNTDIYNRFIAKKADQPYSKQLLGVISSDPGIVLNSSKNIVYDGLKSQTNERALAIAGRVPVKIDPDSAPIEAGDPLTASNKPGLAQKATKSGFVIGKALESWECIPSPLQGEGQGEVCRDRILALIQYGYVNQQLTLDENKNLDVQFAITPIASRSATPAPSYQILDSLGQAVNQIGVFSDAAIANMKVGLVAADKITAKTITIEDLLISPIADIDLLRVKNLIAENATVSGTLIAERLVSPTLDQINSQLSLVTSQYASASSIISSIQAKYTSFGAINNASTSGDPLDTTHLYQENATIADLNVTGSIFADSLNSNSDTLFIQPLGTGSINLLAGLMTLTPDGNVTINGNLNVTGSVLARDITSGKSNVDQLSANKLSLNDLTITTASATESASVGFSTIASSSAEIFIPNSKVSENTLIYVTPIGNTNNQVLYVKEKLDGLGFTVAVPSTPSSDLRFNYWLIKTQ